MITRYWTTSSNRGALHTNASRRQREDKRRRRHAVRVVEFHDGVVGPCVFQNGGRRFAPHPRHVQLHKNVKKSDGVAVQAAAVLTCRVKPSSAMEVMDACWKFLSSESHSTKPFW